MSSTIEFSPFPHDETLAPNVHFFTLVRDWYDVIAEIVESGMDLRTAYEKIEDVKPDFLADAEIFFPDREPSDVVELARWEAMNIYASRREG